MGSSYDSATLMATVFLGFLVFPILYYIGRAIAGKRLKIRKIAGLAAIDEAVGRATEMGRPISFCTGLGGVDLPTLAAVAVLGHVARLSARYDNEVYIPMRDPVLMGIATEVCREAYRSEGKPDQFDPGEHMLFLSGNQFAYASGIMGMMHRKKVAANFLFGIFAAESLILAEAGQQIGAIQVAGTISYTQIPFFITACDYTIIGEELYAASAYLTQQPVQLGSLFGQDFVKMAILLLIIIGVIIGTATQNTDPMTNWLTLLLNMK